MKITLDEFNSFKHSHNEMEICFCQQWNIREIILEVCNKLPLASTGTEHELSSIHTAIPLINLAEKCHISVVYMLRKWMSSISVTVIQIYITNFIIKFIVRINKRSHKYWLLQCDLTYWTVNTLNSYVLLERQKCQGTNSI